MILILPRYFFVISWLIAGPPILALPTIGLLAGGVALVFVLRRSYRERTLALLGIFGLMLVESVFVVGFTLHFIVRAEPAHLVESSRSFFDLIPRLDLGAVLLGAVAAGCAAIFIEFGKSRMSLSKAFPQITFLQPPTRLEESVKRLAAEAGISTPDVRLIDSGMPSAFTVRANRRYTVTVSVGLLESLEDCEVEACLAHEIAHLKNHDFTVRFAATLAKVALFARPMSYLLEPAVYRAREFLADLTAVRLVGGPDALISALTKLKDCSNLELAMPATSCMCNLTGRRGVTRIFDKHPAIEARISALWEMKQK
ncbi:MAG: M48 family metalloprotease [Candidatus Bathyarchaeia archaeon]